MLNVAFCPKSSPWGSAGGWTLNRDLFIAPFDWRLPPTASEKTFIFWKDLIENVSAANNNQPVVLWGYSGGPQWALSFLHRMTSEWKDKFINFFIAVSPVWSGVPFAVPAAVSGISSPNGKGQTLPAAIVREGARVIPSAAWLFPRAGTNSSTTWTKEEAIITTPSKNYTAFDVVGLFEFLVRMCVANCVLTTEQGAEEFAEIVDFTTKDVDLAALEAPGVDTFVAYGYGIPTPSIYEYKSDFEQGKTVDATDLAGVHNSSGDVLVPLRSSLRAQEWYQSPGMSGKQLIYRGYDNMPHAMCWNQQGVKQSTCMQDIMVALRAKKVQH